MTTRLDAAPAVRVAVRRVYIVRMGARGDYRYRSFLSPHAAAKAIAWERIAQRYHIYSQDGVHGLECECFENMADGWGPGFPDSTGCPLHDRRDGYYACLARRFIRLIEAALAELTPGEVFE